MESAYGRHVVGLESAWGGLKGVVLLENRFYIYLLTNTMPGMGGFNNENNKNNPRIYKNSDEFKLCSIFVKEFKIGLHPILKYLKDGELHQRLMSLFMGIKSLDRNSAKGNLNVAEGLRTLKGRALLQQFVFTPKVGIRQMIGNPELNEKDFSLVWKDFDIFTVRWPNGATHLELQYLVLAYDSRRNFFTTYTAAMVRKSKNDRVADLEMRMEKDIARKQTEQYISALGLRFLEILGEEEYPLLGKNAVGVEVFGVF